MQKDKDRAVVAYIASDVRSGSTLLDMLISGHSRLESVGEAQFLKSHFRREGTGYSWDWKCTCGSDFAVCSFWSEVNEEIADQTGRYLAETETWVREKPQLFPLLLLPNWILRHLGKWLMSTRHGIAVGENCWRIMDVVSEKTRKLIVVDSSKNAEQFRYMYLWRPQDMRLIRLVRDGRGVVYSKMRRAGDSSKKAIKNWVRENLKILAVTLLLPKRQKMLLRYEDLCANPQKELARVFHFLGVSEEQIRFSKRDRHNVCGSPRRFEYNELEIRADRRWENELPGHDRAVFNFLGGWLNRLLGYR